MQGWKVDGLPCHVRDIGSKLVVIARQVVLGDSNVQPGCVHRQVHGAGEAFVTIIVDRRKDSPDAHKAGYLSEKLIDVKVIHAERHRDHIERFIWLVGKQNRHVIAVHGAVFFAVTDEKQQAKTIVYIGLHPVDIFVALKDIQAVLVGFRIGEIAALSPNRHQLVVAVGPVTVLNVNAVNLLAQPQDLNTRGNTAGPVQRPSSRSEPMNS